MKDLWCSKLNYKGKDIYGGAARNVRISKSGGMEAIAQDVSRTTLAKANAACENSPKPTGGVVIQFPNKAAQ